MRFLPVIAALAACGTTPDAGPASTRDGPGADRVTIAYQSRVDGEIEPCG